MLLCSGAGSGTAAGKLRARCCGDRLLGPQLPLRGAGVVAVCVKNGDHSVYTAMLQQFPYAEIVLVYGLEPVLFVFGVVFVALLFAAIAVAVGGGAALISFFPMADVRLGFMF